MGRQSSNTADYFMHEAKPGKTLFILEKRWGNDGYSFWYKLLELLTTSEGHFFPLREPPDKEYFRARMNLSGTDPDISASEILDLLAALGNIDKALWVNHRVIWCQNLVDGLADTLYKKRNHPAPKKPSFDSNISDSEIPSTEDIRRGNPETGTESEISDAEIPIGRELVREGGSDEKQPPPSPPSATPEKEPPRLDALLERLYALDKGLLVSPEQRQAIAALLEHDDVETVAQVFAHYRKRKPEKAHRYVLGDFLEDYQAHRAAWSKERPSGRSVDVAAREAEFAAAKTERDSATPAEQYEALIKAARLKHSMHSELSLEQLKLLREEGDHLADAELRRLREAGEHLTPAELEQISPPPVDNFEDDIPGEGA